MRQHADEVSGEQETYYYYQEVLEPLFFETMNTRRPDNVTRWQGIRIPYLNGGLFDEIRDPEGPIVLPDSLFDPNSNEGLLAFFNRYNFTIADDTPLEQDGAVDPEMLGKVFENLLARLLWESQGGIVINTAYIERLNATFRQHLTWLTRRTRTLAHRDDTLSAAMYLLGSVYNFCRFHTMVSFPDRSQRTPAMAAGLTDHHWSIRELLSFKVAPTAQYPA